MAGPETFPIIFVIFAVLFFVMLLLGAAQTAKRLKALREWCLAHGLELDETSERDMEDRYPDFQCLKQGHNRYANNIMRGVWQGWPLVAFDYHYETTSTDSKGRTRTERHHFSAVVLESRLPLRLLSIRPESIFDKLGEFFGMDDIDFESAEFSRRFYVKANDRRWAYDVLHARAMEWLLARPVCQIQLDSPGAIAWTGGIFNAPDFDSTATTLHGLLAGMPEYLVTDLRQKAEMR